MARVLLTWLGNNDPFHIDRVTGEVMLYDGNRRVYLPEKGMPRLGAVAQFISDRLSYPAPGHPRSGPASERPFDVVYLLISPDFSLPRGSAKDQDERTHLPERAARLARRMEAAFPGLVAQPKLIEDTRIHDYLDTYLAVQKACEGILEERRSSAPEDEYTVFASPGTKQMAVAWYLLVASGKVPAELVDNTPEEFKTPGFSPWKVAPVDDPRMPEVRYRSGPDAAEVTALRHRVLELEQQVRVLESTVSLAQSGEFRGGSPEILPAGFSLEAHLAAIERQYFELAYRTAVGNLTRTAELLGPRAPKGEVMSHVGVKKALVRLGIIEGE